MAACCWDRRRSMARRGLCGLSRRGNIDVTLLVDGTQLGETDLEQAQRRRQ